MDGYPFTSMIDNHMGHPKIMENGWLSIHNSIKMDDFPSKKLGGNKEEKHQATPNAKSNTCPPIPLKCSNQLQFKAHPNAPQKKESKQNTNNTYWVMKVLFVEGGMRDGLSSHIS